MRRPTLEIYAASVCFATVLCAAIGTGILLYSIVQVAAPSVTAPQYNYPAMPAPIVVNPSEYPPDVTVGPPSLSAEEIDKRREVAAAAAMENERRSGIQSLIRWAIATIVSGALFALHWRLLHRGARSA